MGIKILGELKDRNGIVLMKVFVSNAAPRRRLFRVHHHVEFELGMILEGRGIYSGKKEYVISPGDIYFYKNNEPHCIVEIEDEGITLLNFYISPLYFRHLMSRGENERFGADFAQKRFAESRINDFLSPSDAEIVSQMMLRIADEMRDRADGYEFMVENCLNAALVILSRNALPSDEKGLRVGSNYERIFNSAAFIDEHYRENLSLDDLARDANLERTYFSALFKKIIGLSPCEYISVKRIERATELLRSTDMSTLDVAVACGFNNTANFNKQFKRYSGTTPSSLRH